MAAREQAEAEAAAAIAAREAAEAEEAAATAAREQEEAEAAAARAAVASKTINVLVVKAQGLKHSLMHQYVVPPRTQVIRDVYFSTVIWQHFDSFLKTP